MAPRCITTDLRAGRLWEETTLPVPDTPDALHTVCLYPDCTDQTLDGFGGAFTESAAVCWQSLPDAARDQYFDTAVNIYQNDEVANAPEWSAPWYNSMAGALPVLGADADVWGTDADALQEMIDSGSATTEVFSYVMPSWGALIVRDNAGDNKGKFGLCSGPCSFFCGGTFLAVNEFSENKEAAMDFIKFVTLNEETSQWWLEASEGDVVSMKSVLEANKDYENPSFGNQKTYAFYMDELEKIDYSKITGYDDACKDAFGAAIVSVQKGEATKEDAMKTFYETVKNTYPELEVPAE